MSEKGNRSARSVSQSLVATFTAVASVSGRADEAIAVAAFSSALQPLFEEQLQWVLDVIRRFTRNRRIAPKELEAELATSPAKQELLIRALEGARLASAEEKRRAIAASITAGFESDIAAARENDVLRAITDLDLAHVLALGVLNSARKLDNRAAFLNPTHFDSQDLGTIDINLAGLEDRLMAVLVSEGLALNEPVSSYDGVTSAYRITDFGRLVLLRFSVDETE